MTESTKSVRTQRTIARACAEGARLFAEKGYSETTTRELAAAMDFTNGTFYYYFSSKEDLLRQICVDAIEETTSAVMKAVDAAGSSKEAVSALIHAHIKTLLDSRHAHTTMLAELRALTGEHRAVVLAARARYEKLVRGVIDAGQKDGTLSTEIGGGMLSLMLHNLLNWTIFWNPDTSLTSDYIADRMVTLFLDGAANRG
jgi:AcrR family transcriptional regulator